MSVLSLLFDSCCKDSANRMKNQINLSFSAVQPIFEFFSKARISVQNTLKMKELKK